ncbi:PDZ domain-containing protein [Nocardioides sp.]|uniref:YlbL family protein n=1 Tax=Nocardioides sp. TaxID=35761 RepID=UPI0039E5A540
MQMSQRTLAGLIAVPLVLVLLLVALLTPLPYVVYRPGMTLDVLGEDQGKPIVEVSGLPVYPVDGQLRMVTVSVTRPDTKLTLPGLMAAWFDKHDAVYPWSAVYQSGETDADSESEGAAQMSSSQDIAAGVALREDGVDVTAEVSIGSVVTGSPAAGQLQAGDVIDKVDGEKITSADQLIDLVSTTPAGQQRTFTISRDGVTSEVSIAPVADDDGTPRIGASLAERFLDLPVDVELNIDSDIGGPSAGLMFSLAIFDTLTPGALTGGHDIAGTGEIATTGAVGEIGGIQQKIAGAHRDGAELFLVPPGNCEEALGADNGDMRLVRADTMHDAVEAITTWVADPKADLPTCEDQ